MSRHVDLEQAHRVNAMGWLDHLLTLIALALNAGVFGRGAYQRLAAESQRARAAFTVQVVNILPSPPPNHGRIAWLWNQR
jgi:hypothetical protein